MRSRFFLAAGVAATAAMASAAPVDFSVVNRAASGELGHRAALSQIYSGHGDFSASEIVFGGTNFKSALRTRVVSEFTSADGTITARRVIDRDGLGLLNIGSGVGTADDQNWMDGTVRFRAEVKQASDNSVFGFIDDANGSIATVIGNTGAIGVISPEFNMSTNFRWFLRNRSQKVTYTSSEADNDGSDHLITYEIIGLDVRTFLLFWEDRGIGDFDYNDSVIQLRLVSRPPTSIPLPSAAAKARAMAAVRILRFINGPS